MQTATVEPSKNRISGLVTADIFKHPSQLKHRRRSPQWLALAALMSVIFLTGARFGASAADTETNLYSPLFKNTLPLAIDLKPSYTFKGDVGYGGFSGEQTLDGLPFDVTGQITLYGKTSAQRGSHDPHKVTGIKINRWFDELHLIHDAVWEDAVGRTVAIIRLHYADGTTHDFDLKYGVNVADWNRLLSEETESLTDPHSKIIRHYPGVDKGTGRLFATTLINPHPEIPVATMDVISADGWANYRLAAATVARADPQRPVTRGLLLNMPPRHFDGALAIKIVDDETGKPIAGADVLGFVYMSGVGIVVPPLLTSVDGETAIKYPVATTTRIGFSVSKEGYLGRRGYWQSGNFPKSITYKLVHAAASIQGRVLDDAGQPVAGAQVSLNNYNFDSDGGQIYLPNASATTDKDGHWSIEGLPKDYQDFGITVSDPDFPQAQFYADGPHKRGFQGAHIATADFYAGTAILKLAGGKTLAGMVRDEQGHPVARATVFIGFDCYMSGAIKSQTDAGGGFSLKNLKPGENYLTVSASGFAPDFRTLWVTNNAAPIQVVLKPGNTVRGHVMDAAGKPVSGANVSFDGLANRQGMFQGRTIEWNAKTDANGDFKWDSAPAEPVRLSIRQPGYMALEWMTVQTGVPDATTFTLNPALTVKGDVTDADGGAPISSFTVTPGWSQVDGSVRFEKRQSSTGSAGHYEVHFESPLVISSTPFDFVFEVSAPGYAPARSRAIKPGEGTVTWNVQLKKARANVCTVKTADGKPVSGIKVYLARRQDYLQLDDTEIFTQNQDSESYETDAGGHFDLPPQVGDFSLLAASPAGFALVSAADFTNRHAMTLQPWGRVEGTLLNHGQPYAGHDLYFFIGDGTQQRNVWMRTPATVDAVGHFVFPHVPAGTIRIELKQPMTEQSWSYKELQTVEARPGETNTVQIALNGRDVIGHWQRDAGLTDDLDWQRGSFSLRPVLPPPPVPKDLADPEKVQAWYQEWEKTDDGKKFMEAQRKMASLQVKSDGTLRAEAVAPGKYTLSGNFWGSSGTIAEIESREVEIPASTTDNSDAPFDLGTVVIKAVKHLNIGENAPEFEVKTLDGQPLKLSDYRGKYVLLDFWATWCGPCVAETPHLKDTYEACGGNPRFVMISLSLDQKTDLPKKFAEKNGIKWIQGFLGDWNKDTVTKDYCVRGIPSIFLINPEGKIVAMDLRGDAIKNTVGSTLNAR